MSDTLARLLAERESLERGMPGMLALSVSGHVALLLIAVVGPMLMPKEPPLRVADGFAVALPRGGGGAPAPPPQVKAPEPEPVEQQPPPAPTVVKPPPKAEPRPEALPLPDSRRKKPRATPPPLATPGTLPPASTASAASRSSAAATPGLEFGPPGPGVPGGTDTGGDWYLAGVQQKIWTIWNQQLKAGYTQSVGVSFTILPDGGVTGVRVTQPSGASLLDMAAQRAILNAAPFGPLPREYGDKPRTITALFKPVQ